MNLCKYKDCTNECLPGRRYCKTHFLQRKKELYHQKRNAGIKHRTLYLCTCLYCGKEFKGFKQTSKFCSVKCFQENSKKFSLNATNNYEYSKEEYRTSLVKHRVIVENILNRRLEYNEVVHHLDGNPKNNSLDNLLLMSRQDHSSLHAYLRIQGATLERSNDGIDENCWKPLIASMTTAWLETTSANVQKLSEIGQSAAEPL